MKCIATAHQNIEFDAESCAKPLFFKERAQGLCTIISALQHNPGLFSYPLNLSHTLLIYNDNINFSVLYWIFLVLRPLTFS
jgi:hypothetical protein